jgi:hypothetical protein
MENTGNTDGNSSVTHPSTGNLSSFASISNEKPGNQAKETEFPRKTDGIAHASKKLD